MNQRETSHPMQLIVHSIDAFHARQATPYSGQSPGSLEQTGRFDDHRFFVSTPEKWLHSCKKFANGEFLYGGKHGAGMASNRDRLWSVGDGLYYKPSI
jgi:hypothetical protein